ncbi:hypothetical protein TBLA_0H03560 [Henningerozyma blattae CBS 6284]|uniref:Uncharacterized protein n=1 Tax=Henningerozyma blattae (strain ATCC 34711 / CBS 6284 / DSM 70876 / NBRC 10599 / NRRL Y-10934 / UCD 77-7) TaxID=1071380 RepID=I2H8D5_HENB6|nr:hypothetical protein TBLA_0H03560 [Tetrapisispora blattae CBS 6284]CCH62637.1 hypothetical protein TBLA_0H03560 [Tetrapisispora blattae CBS 6284]
MTNSNNTKINLKILEPTNHVASWPEIQTIIKSGQLPELRRTPECNDKYQLFKKNLASRNVSVAQHMLNQLGWNMDENNRLNQTGFPDLESKVKASFASRESFKILQNDFPYSYDPQIVHLLIWSKIKLPIYKDESINLKNEELNSKINRFLKLNMEGRENVIDYDWFINYTVLQSIEAVSHIHLLVYLKDVESFDLKAFSTSFIPLSD